MRHSRHKACAWVLLALSVAVLGCEDSGNGDALPPDPAAERPLLPPEEGARGELRIELEIPEQGIRPRFPVLMSYSVTNSGSHRVELPVTLHPYAGTLKLFVERPDGAVSEPFALESCAAEGVPQVLEPGQSYGDAFSVQLGGDGEYLFREGGVYRLFLAAAGGGEEADLPVEVYSNLVELELEGVPDPGSDLLEHPEVRKLMRLEGGMHLQEALARLEETADLDEATVYRGLANYYSGLAHLRAGGSICGGETELELLNVGLARLHLAYQSFAGEAEYLSKRSAWWLSRCYTQLEIPDQAEEFESIFRSIELPFFGREAARLDRSS